MKTTLFAFGLLAATAIASAANADKLDDIISSGVLRCAVVLDFPPMGSRDADNNPIGFDFATSVAARGEVELHRIAGTPLPEGWAVDADGAPTRDAAAALQGAMLPFGGHKGSAISMMIELLAGVMIGDLTSPEALAFIGTTTVAPRHGELILAFCPDRFAAARGGLDQTRAEALFDAVLGQGARLPSQRRYAARAVSEMQGIFLTADEQAMLHRLKNGGLGAVP